MAHPLARSIELGFFALLALTGFLLVGGAGHIEQPQSDPFRIGSKPTTSGYISASIEQVNPDLIEVPMIAAITGISATFQAKDFSSLRRAIDRKSVDLELLDDENLLGVMHLIRKDEQAAYTIHQLDTQRLAIRSIEAPDQVWGISAKAFERLQIRWPEIKPSTAVDQGPGSTESNAQTQSSKLPHPHTQSTVLLDTRTIKVRIKASYPKLTRTLDDEEFRVRLPRDYKPHFPAGVLVWISPTQDGRIPEIFEPALDELGFIAVGVDMNGNNRPITDRLQNHLDSIETLAQHHLIDRKRIYLTGMSGGGRCSGILQIAFPDLFAGAVPIVGMDTYHNAPTGDPGKFWPARLGKPAARWLRILKERRIAGITGTTDFNEPEMRVRQEQLKRDGIEMRLDIVEGMGHTMPSADQFTSALQWTDEPRRDSMVSDFRQAKEILQKYLETAGDSPASTRKDRMTLIKILRLAPWTEPAWTASALLGYPQPD